MIALRTAHYRNDRAHGVASFHFGNTHGASSNIGRNLAGFIQREIVARTIMDKVTVSRAAIALTERDGVTWTE